MPKNKMIVVLGVLVALLPVLGFPRGWEYFFQVVAGLGIVLISVWATIDRKLTLRAKAEQRRRAHKERLMRMGETEAEAETGAEEEFSHPEGEQQI